MSDRLKCNLTVACCVPKQHKNRESKLKWLDEAMGKTECGMFLTPQEFFGGTVMMNTDLHMPIEWVKSNCSSLARNHGMILGVGAATKQESGGATEDYHYFDSDGSYCGAHTKFALPAYDDVRTKGAGQMWPETKYSRRIKVVEIPSNGMKIGTLFCWEVFSLTIVPAYTFQGMHLLVHPIKFAPRGWLKMSKPAETGTKNVIGFDQAPKSQIWCDRLTGIGRHVSICPIAVSCNTWNLGAKYLALCGHVDEQGSTTDLHELPSTPEQDFIHTFEITPSRVDALRTALFSAGHFKAIAGDVNGFSKLKEWTMHSKMQRLEAQLIGGSTRMDCKLLAATAGRQKKKYRLVKR